MIVGGLLEALFTPKLPDLHALSAVAEIPAADTVRFDDVLTPLLPIGVDDGSLPQLLDPVALPVPDSEPTPTTPQSGEILPLPADQAGIPLPPPSPEVPRAVAPELEAEPKTPHSAWERSPERERDEESPNLGDVDVAPVVATLLPAVVTLPPAEQPLPVVVEAIVDVELPVVATTMSHEGVRPLRGTTDAPDDRVLRALDRLTARPTDVRDAPPAALPKTATVPAPAQPAMARDPQPMSLVPQSSTAPTVPSEPSASLPPTSVPVAQPNEQTVASPLVASANSPTPPPAAQVAPPAVAPQAVVPQSVVPAPTVPTRDKQTAEATPAASDAPVEPRASWQNALPRELRELATAAAPQPDFARRHTEAAMSTLAERVMMMRAAGQSGASVTLEPESLGRVDVHVRVHADTTHVSFIVQHAAVRDVVEASLPRLRTMLEDAGLSLGDVNVGHSDQGSRQPRAEAERRWADGSTMAREDAPIARQAANDSRLVDIRV